MHKIILLNFVTFDQPYLIAIHWKVVCEIIKNTIGESPLDKLVLEFPRRNSPLVKLPRGKFPLVKLPYGEFSLLIFSRGNLPGGKLPRIYQCIFLHHLFKETVCGNFQSSKLEIV